MKSHLNGRRRSTGVRNWPARHTALTASLSAFCFAFTPALQAFPDLGLAPDSTSIESSFVTVEYVGDNSSGLLSASGFATSLALPGSPSNNITGGSFSIEATISFNAQTASGTLSIGGTIAALGFNSGTLLTGTFSSTAGNQTFGAGAGDPLEFLFTVTGGDAAGLYGSLAGVILSSSGFNGSFASDFTSAPFGAIASTFDQSSTLTVDGVIESTEGGFRFPDGTFQTTAVMNAAPSFDFAGFTFAQVIGSDIGRLHGACQDFTANPAARMASTQEFIESPTAVLPATPAWVRPVLVGVSRDSSNRIIQVDFSGAALTGAVGCFATDGFGVTIGNDGKIGRESCDTVHVVACSIPASGHTEK